jgi:hypothetical protein
MQNRGKERLTLRVCVRRTRECETFVLGQSHRRYVETRLYERVCVRITETMYMWEYSQRVCSGTLEAT